MGGSFSGMDKAEEVKSDGEILASRSQSSQPQDISKFGEEVVPILPPIPSDMEKIDKYLLCCDAIVLDLFLQFLRGGEKEHYCILQLYFVKPLKCMRAIMYRHKYSSRKDLDRVKAMHPPTKSRRTNFNHSDKKAIMKIYSKIFPETSEKTKEKIYSLAYRKDYYIKQLVRSK